MLTTSLMQLAWNSLSTAIAVPQLQLLFCRPHLPAVCDRILDLGQETSTGNAQALYMERSGALMLSYLVHDITMLSMN